MGLKKKLLKLVVPKGFYILINGHCPICEKDSSFTSEDLWVRENLVCLHCKCISRERALMLMIEEHYPDWRNLSIHESSPGKRGVSNKLKQQCEI
jgi:transcription initiation factor TFIIIB Brf1 subunit/transcription initiation factor TFIIB